MALAVHVPTYRPLTRCGAEELAAHQNTAPLSGGILFARKQEREQKDEARRAILDLLSPEQFSNDMTVLTMPGVDWKFERKLLGLREGDWYRAQTPKRTRIYAVENDRVIYHGALLKMPGLQHKGSIVKVLPPTEYAERCVSTSWVERFYFGNVDDLMRADHQYDAAWLDYTGPLSIPRLTLIRHFFQQSIRAGGVLIVTSLRARWNRDASDAIERVGGHSEWFWKFMHAEKLHDIDYQDGQSPMAQFAMRRNGQ